jgi:transcriptional regulator with PAS, ATPase and Fis domain
MDLSEKIMRAALGDATVLILGATGTARKMLAHLLHLNSARRHGPFHSVNCAVAPGRLIESELFGLVRGERDGYVGGFGGADGGTLFLDEVAELDDAMQVKLLHFLKTSTVRPAGGYQDKKVDARVLSGTSHDIDTMVKDGRFREDLYYRLNVVTIDLRDCPEAG